MRVPHKRPQRLALAAALVALAAGCTSLMPKHEDWKGHKISELIARRGPADRIMLYPYGGTLYIWETADPTLDAGNATSLDGDSAVAGFLHREIVLVSDAGVILQTQVTDEPAGAR